MANHIKRKAPQNIETVEEVVAKSVFEKEFAGLKKELEKQQSLTWQVVIGVGVAFVLAIGVVIVDAVLSRKTYVDQMSGVFKELYEAQKQVGGLKNDIDGIRARNPYLK